MGRGQTSRCGVLQGNIRSVGSNLDAATDAHPPVGYLLLAIYCSSITISIT